MINLPFMVSFIPNNNDNNLKTDLFLTTIGSKQVLQRQKMGEIEIK